MTRRFFQDPATVASICLGVFYAWVGYRALHPSVSPEYAAYYIHQTSALTIREQRTVTPLELGNTYPVTAPVVALDGWSPWNGTMRRNARRDPAIIFLLVREAVQRRDLSLRLWTVEPIGVGSEVTLNRIPVAVRGFGTLMEIDLPVEAVRIGENVVAFKLPRTGAVTLASIGLGTNGRVDE